jgi:hypothetical protein
MPTDHADPCFVRFPCFRRSLLALRQVAARRRGDDSGQPAQYFPAGSVDFVNPTGRTYQDGVSTLARYVVKLNGSYDLPWALDPIPDPRSPT